MNPLTPEKRKAYGLEKLPKSLSKKGWNCYAKFYIPGQPVPQPEDAEYFDTVAEAVEALCLYDCTQRLARGPSEVFLYSIGQSDPNFAPWILPDAIPHGGYYIGPRGKLRKYTMQQLFDDPPAKYHQRIPYTPPAKYKN